MQNEVDLIAFWIQKIGLHVGAYESTRNMKTIHVSGPTVSALKTIISKYSQTLSVYTAFNS